MKFQIGTNINGLVIQEEFDEARRYKVCCETCGDKSVFTALQISRKKYKGTGCQVCNFRGKSTDDLSRITRLMHSQYATNARVRGLEFKLTLEEFKSIVTKRCMYCASEGITRYDPTRTKSMRLCGVDRIDPRLGYLFENCAPACTICNRAKRDMSLSDFKNWVCRLAKQRETW